MKKTLSILTVLLAMTATAMAQVATGYYHMSSKATSRNEHLYNDATHTGNGGRVTLQSDTKVTTNNGIWYITNLGDNKIGIKNGDGNPIKADKGSTAGPTVNSPSVPQQRPMV